MSGEWISEPKSRICELGEASSCASLSGDSVRNESCVPVSKIVSWLCNNDPFNFNKPPDKPLLPLTVKKSAKVWLSGQARSAAEQWQVQLRFCCKIFGDLQVSTWYQSPYFISGCSCLLCVQSLFIFSLITAAQTNGDHTGASEQP